MAIVTVNRKQRRKRGSSPFKMSHVTTGYHKRLVSKTSLPKLPKQIHSNENKVLPRLVPLSTSPDQTPASRLQSCLFSLRANVEDRSTDFE